MKSAIWIALLTLCLPTLGFTQPVLGSSGTPVTFLAGGSPVAVDPTLTVSDSNFITGAIMTVAIFVTGDTLNFIAQNGISGSYNGATGLLSLSGTASTANYQAALESITYSFNPSTGDPTAGGTSTSRTISVQCTDSLSQANPAYSTTLKIITPTPTATATPTSTNTPTVTATPTITSTPTITVTSVVSANNVVIGPSVSKGGAPFKLFEGLGVSSVQVQVYTSAGQLVKTTWVGNGNILTWTPTGIASGFYLAQITTTLTGGSTIEKTVHLVVLH